MLRKLLARVGSCFRSLTAGVRRKESNDISFNNISEASLSLAWDFPLVGLEFAENAEPMMEPETVGSPVKYSNHGFPCEVSPDGVLQAVFVDCEGTLFCHRPLGEVAEQVKTEAQKRGLRVVVWTRGEPVFYISPLREAGYDWPVVSKMPGGDYHEKVAVMIDDRPRPIAEWGCGFQSVEFISAKLLHGDV